MPISPTGSSQGLSLAPSGGQLSGKYLRNTSLKSRGSRDGANDGSLIKKGLVTHTKHGNLVKEARIKKNAGAVVRDIDSLRYTGINIHSIHNSLLLYRSYNVISVIRICSIPFFKPIKVYYFRDPLIYSHAVIGTRSFIIYVPRSLKRDSINLFVSSFSLSRSNDWSMPELDQLLSFLSPSLRMTT